MRRHLPAGVLLLLFLSFALGVETASALPPDRGWELISPAEKGGGSISAPTDAPAGSFKAAAQGGAIAYASPDSFANPLGASPFSQYISTRAAGTWNTQNITPAQLSGAYEAAPYLAFSEDLSTGLLLNPRRCEDGDPCPEGFKLIDLPSGTTLASLEDTGELEIASEDLDHIVLQRGIDFYLWSPPSTTLTPITDPADSPAAPAEGTFFIDAGHLYRHYAGGSRTDLTPSGGADAFLGSDATGQIAFYRSAGTIFRWAEGSGATPILTHAALTDPSRQTSTATATANRLFFTTAAPLIAGDSNSAPDVYQWQSQGTGTCTAPSGCTDLISAAIAGASILAGASDNGTDVYFTTESSLAFNDKGSVDLYSARIGGGFPTPTPPVICEGDTCQGIVLPPDEPIPGTARGKGPTDPPAHYVKQRRAKRKRCAKGKVRKGRKCVRKRAGGRR